MTIEKYFKELEKNFNKKQIRIIKKTFYVIKKDYQEDQYYDIINICCFELLKNSDVDYSHKINLLFDKVRSELNLGTKNIRTFSTVDDVDFDKSYIDVSTIGFSLGEQEENVDDYFNDEVLLDLISGMSITEVANNYGIKYSKVLEILRDTLDKSKYNITVNNYVPKFKRKVKTK